MRLSFRLLAALCLVLLGLACGSDEQDPNAAHDDSSELPVAVVEESLRPPGTLLAPAVEVQAGSLLVGTSVPVIRATNEPQWSRDRIVENPGKGSDSWADFVFFRRT